MMQPPTTASSVLLVGLPNVGKSVFFGALTGTYVAVSNYPGTTVELSRGSSPALEGRTIIDTPGTHNLVPMSEDEAVTRDVLLDEPTAPLLQVGDAKNLVRTLLLALQLGGLARPRALALNMADEARARGLRIDTTRLAQALGCPVFLAAAVHGEGVETAFETLRDLGEADAPVPEIARVRNPTLAEAIAQVARELPDSVPVPRETLAEWLLSGDRSASQRLEALAGARAAEVARTIAASVQRKEGAPFFALVSRDRLQRVQALAREVTTREAVAAHDAAVQASTASKAITTTAIGAATTFAVGHALAPFEVAPHPATDPLAELGFLDFLGNTLAGDRTFLSPTAVAFGLLAAAIGARALAKHTAPPSAVWKAAGAIFIGLTSYTLIHLAYVRVTGHDGALPILLGATAGLGSFAAMLAGGRVADVSRSAALGRSTTDRWRGLPVLAFSLYFAYQFVGVFGAGSAVDALENRFFGGVQAELGALVVVPPVVPEGAAPGTLVLAVTRTEEGASAVTALAVNAAGDALEPSPATVIDVYPEGASRAPMSGVGRVTVPVHAAEHATVKVWSGVLNRWVFGLVHRIGSDLLTRFLVGPYGLVTMGMTYAIAIVLPVVATFFFVFSMLEDSGYLPRLAVMANRALRMLGLNGRAVLPMILGLGCDTMATLTARILETKKERVLVTFLLALAVPCSSQLSVVFALMQRTNAAATAVWVGVVLFTLFVVGFVAARTLPGDPSDFVMELPPLRLPKAGNLASKTMARIEWYLKEAVPLFLAGTLLLFFLDSFALLPLVHRLGEPVVHHALGFAREGGVADRVSEALLVGFLRRDFGAAGLLELARAGHLSAADVAVSMVTITLFIPCIANVFMVVKEQGAKAALAMSGFIFPYAIFVGAVVRAGWRLFAG
jgi:Fe2+ transport system protein B